MVRDRMVMEKQQYEEVPFTKKQDLNFKMVVSMHMNRLSYLTVNIQERGVVKAFYFGVEFLESMLSPYLKEEYYENKKRLIETIQKNFEDKKNTKLLTWEWDADSKEPCYLEYGLAIFECLQELAAKKGWLLTEEAELPVV